MTTAAQLRSQGQFIRDPAPFDLDLMAVDHFYAADHADEYEEAQWDRLAEQVARMERENERHQAA